MRFHHFNQDAPGWETLEDRTLCANPYAEMHRVRVISPMRPGGADWTVIHRKGACVVAPITGQGNLVLIRQERIPVRSAIWEFPAGQIDEAGGGADGEVIRRTALRELAEESGYELAPGGELIPLGLFFSSPGVMDEHNYLFAARPVVPSPRGAAHEAGEAIGEIREVTPLELRRWIASGEIRDANTLSAFARLTALGLL